MSKLQNDFTTPEQSKRLLELGVPADSANCYYTQEEIEGNMYWFDLHIKRDYQPHSSLHASTIWKETLPCWSVGRLVEILGICEGMERVDFEKLARTEGTWPDRLIRLIEDLAKYDKLDFSKLDE